MDEKFLISSDGTLPDELKGQELDRTNTVDKDVVQRYFKHELFGADSCLVNHYSTKTKNMKYSSHEVDTSKMSFIKYRLYIRKREQQIKLLEKKEQQIKKIMDLAQKHASIIVNLCSKYGLNIDGAFRKNSEYKKILLQLSNVADLNTRKEFSAQMDIVRYELNQSFKLLKENIQQLYIHDVYFADEISLSKFSYADLDKSVDKKDSLLDQILNDRITEKINLKAEKETKVDDFGFNGDFAAESINKGKEVFPVYSEIDFLKNSKFLKTNELDLLMHVENAYNDVSNSYNKLIYIKDILSTLGSDERFVKVAEALKKQEKEEALNFQELLAAAKKMYNDYDVKGHIELAQKQQEIDVVQGELLFDIEKAKKSEDYNKRWVSEDKLHESQLAERKVNNRTIMAQYMREKAFKTNDGKLTFAQYVEKYAVMYGLDEVAKKCIIQEMEINNGRKL